MLRDRSLEISHVLLTHWHHDHTGGLLDLYEFMPELCSRVYKHSPDIGQNSIVNGSVFRTEGATIRAIHTPGHAFDHVCFVLEEENAIFTGDNVLGDGFTVVEDLGQYMKSLDYMQSQRCRTGYPGHGDVIKDLPMKMRKYIQHRNMREEQLFSALSRRRSELPWNRRTTGGALTVRELVAAVHGHVSNALYEEILEPTVTEVLWKLAEDRRVGFQVLQGCRRWFAQPGVQFQQDQQASGPHKAFSDANRIEVY